MGRLVQHRAPPQRARRLHPRSRREAALRSQKQPARSRLIQANRSPDLPGRLTITPATDDGPCWAVGLAAPWASVAANAPPDPAREVAGQAPRGVEDGEEPRSRPWQGFLITQG